MSHPPRQADYNILPMFTERWSARAFTDETIGEAELHSLFEAARWAPSAFNAQPWRFLYARRGTPLWEPFVQLLMPYNQGWAQHAAALVYLLSAPTYAAEGKPEPQKVSHGSFSAGTAWGFLALQAQATGWVAHGMAGIEVERIRQELKVPDDFAVEIGIAIGRLGPVENLPEKLQAREFPSLRRPVDAFAFEGAFPAG